jgi:Ca2+-binding RTX toxin-like protein
LDGGNGNDTLDGDDTLSGGNDEDDVVIYSVANSSNKGKTQ